MMSITSKGFRGAFMLKRVFSTKPGPVSADVLAALPDPLILDVRDPSEVALGKGGPPASIFGSLNVPLNHNGTSQHERPTTAEELLFKIKEAGVELTDKNAAIITHCGSGGRGGRAAALLTSLGFSNVHNGGGPSHIASALSLPKK